MASAALSPYLLRVARTFSPTHTFNSPEPLKSRANMALEASADNSPPVPPIPRPRYLSMDSPATSGPMASSHTNSAMSGQPIIMVSATDESLPVGGSTRSASAPPRSRQLSYKSDKSEPPRLMSAESFLKYGAPPTSPPTAPSTTGATYQQVFYYLPPRHRLSRSLYPAPLDPNGPYPGDMDQPPPPPPEEFGAMVEEENYLRRVRPIGDLQHEDATLPQSHVSHPSFTRGESFLSIPSDHSHTNAPHHMVPLPLPGRPLFWDNITPRTAAALRHLQEPILMDGDVVPSVPRSVCDITPRLVRLPSLEGNVRLSYARKHNTFGPF